MLLKTAEVSKLAPIEQGCLGVWGGRIGTESGLPVWKYPMRIRF